FTYMALFSQRNIPLFAIAIAPLLAAQLAALPPAVSLGGWAGRTLAGFGAWLARRDRVYTALDARATGHLWPILALAGLIWLAGTQQQAGRAPLGVQFDPQLQPVAAVA